MRPSIYKRELEFSKFSFSNLVKRNPSIKDIYEVYSQVLSQPFYDFSLLELKIVTDDIIITDMANFRGMANTLKGENAILKPGSYSNNSEIECLSRDNKCAVKIGTSHKYHNIFAMIFNSQLSYNAIEISVGSPLDISVDFYKKISEELDAEYNEQNEDSFSQDNMGEFQLKSKRLADKIEKLWEKRDEIENPSYTLEEIEKFRKFVEHIKGLKF